MVKEQEKQLLFHSKDIDQDDLSVVLLRETVKLQEIRAKHVYVLDDEANSSLEDISLPSITYRTMLELVFQADTVIVI